VYSLLWKNEHAPESIFFRVSFLFSECKHDLLQQHPRFPQMTQWKDGWDYHANMMRLRHEDNHPMHPLHYSHLMQTPSMERKECIDGLSPSIRHDKLPLLFHNPKAIEEAGISYATDQHHHHCPLHHQRHQFGNCSFSATEITPVKTTPVQPRVNDSGRALSLLSHQTHGTTHGVIGPHHPCPHHQALHWNHHEDMALHQHWNDICVEHVVVRSTALSSHMHSSEDTELEKDGYKCSYMHNDDGFERSDHQSTRSLATRGYGKMKRTRDLMQMCSFSSVSNTVTSQSLTTGTYGQSDGSAAATVAAFQLQSGSLGDIKCSYRTLDM
jgi:hypothetical protein